MKFFRVHCPNCRRLYPVPVNANAFACPKCHFPVRFVPTLEGTGWVVDNYRELANIQVVHSLDELIAGSQYRGGGRAVGAARARKMMRSQRKYRRQRHMLRLSTLMVILLCVAIPLMGTNIPKLTGLPQLAIPQELIDTFYLLAQPAEAAPAAAQISIPTMVPTASPTATPLPPVSAKGSAEKPTATPLPSATPTITATFLSAGMLQATAWQATVQAAIVTSYAKETEHSARQSITETAISARQTEWSGIRQTTATPKP